MNIRLLHVVVVLSFAGLLPGCAVESKCGVDGCPGDAKITTNVQSQISQHPDLAGVNSISVKTLDHVVYLSGEVSAGLMSQTAYDIARTAPGVVRVENNIAVTH